jgi:hypothetical protein
VLCRSSPFSRRLSLSQIAPFGGPFRVSSSRTTVCADADEFRVASKQENQFRLPALFLFCRLFFACHFLISQRIPNLEKERLRYRTLALCGLEGVGARIPGGAIQREEA